MNSRRTVTLITAVVAAAIAAFGLMNYMNAEGGGSSAAQVWMVTEPIPQGTAGEDAVEMNLITQVPMPEDYVPATAIIDPEVELAGLVAKTDLDPNFTLVDGLFVSPAVAHTGIADRLEERGLVTVTFNVDQTKGVAHMVEPGDRVNVMLERQWDAPFFDADPPVAMSESAKAELAEHLRENDTTRPVLNDIYQYDVRFLYQGAEVLAVGDRLVPGFENYRPAADDEFVDYSAGENDGMITLAVPPKAAQTILAAGRENIYLSLVPVDYEPVPIQPIDPTRQVLPGEVEGSLTPYDEALMQFDDGIAFTNDEERIGQMPSGGVEIDTDQELDS